MLVSVVIPCYNVEKCVADCLESVLNQTYTSMEIICVDDGSTDQTLDILSSFQLRFPNTIRLIKSPHRGAPSARNTGLYHAKGSYIQFLDADDLLMRDKLKHQITLIRNAPVKPALVAASYYQTNVDGKTNLHPISSNHWIGLICSDLGCTCSNLWATPVIRNIHGWDEELASSQEYDLMFRVLKAGGQILHDPRPMTIVRKRLPGQSISTTDLPLRWQRFIDLRIDILKYLDHENLITQQLFQILHQKLFTSILRLFHYRRKLALDYYFRIIPTNFHPDISLRKAPNYGAACKSLAFKAIHEFRCLIQHM